MAESTRKAAKKSRVFKAYLDTPYRIRLPPSSPQTQDAILSLLSTHRSAIEASQLTIGLSTTVRAAQRGELCALLLSRAPATAETPALPSSILYHIPVVCALRGVALAVLMDVDKVFVELWGAKDMKHASVLGVRAAPRDKPWVQALLGLAHVPRVPWLTADDVCYVPATLRKMVLEKP
jgi:hypothetical protein